LSPRPAFYRCRMALMYLLGHRRPQNAAMEHRPSHCIFGFKLLLPMEKGRATDNTAHSGGNRSARIDPAADEGATDHWRL
jgi:hypothetical protein